MSEDFEGAERGMNMGYMFYDTREEYVEQINLLLNRADICELNKFLKILLKHFWPNCI